MNGGPITLETSVSHGLFDRRSVLTIVLNGGDLTEREAAVRAILAQLAPQYPNPAADRPAGLSPVFALLSRPEPPHAESASPYDDPFILAPLGSITA